MWIHDTSARVYRHVSVGMTLATALLLLQIMGSIARAEELPLDRINPRGHSGDVLAVARREVERPDLAEPFAQSLELLDVAVAGDAMEMLGERQKRDGIPGGHAQDGEVRGQARNSGT